MKTNYNRAELRRRVDPEFVRDISQSTIEDAVVNGLTYTKQFQLRMILHDTVIPIVRDQLEQLHQYKHLLTYQEQDLVDQYAGNFSDYLSKWQQKKPLSFPTVPKGFEDILK